EGGRATGRQTAEGTGGGGGGGGGAGAAGLFTIRGLRRAGWGDLHGRRSDGHGGGGGSAQRPEPGPAGGRADYGFCRASVCGVWDSIHRREGIRPSLSEIQCVYG